MTASAAPSQSAWTDSTAWLTAALAAAGTVWAAAPANNWLDSAELVACASELGNVHPPGHPAWLSLSQLARLLPFGPFSWRIAVFSALAMAACVFLVVRLGRALWADHGGRSQTSVWGLLAALALASSGSLWQVSVRPEVYTLALAGNLWALHAAWLAGHWARRHQPPPRLVAGYLGSWAIAVCIGLLNHHYVALFALPAQVLAGWPALRWLLRSRPRLALLLLALCAWLGLGYLALALRGLADTEMRWGDPTSVQGLWDTVTAKHFQRNLTEIHVDYLDNLLVLLGATLEAMGPLAVAGAVGLVLGVLWRDRVQAVLWLALLGGLATKGVLQVDTRNPDDHGYLLMAPAVLALGLGQLGVFLGGRRGLLAAQPRRARQALSVLLGMAVFVDVQHIRGLWQAPETQLGQLRAPDAVDTQVRNALPPGALLLSNYYGLGFNEQAFRIAEGRRPDLAVPHLSLRTGDTDHGAAWQRWFATRHPEYRALTEAAHALQRAPVGNLLALAESQPVWAEQDPDLRLPPGVYGFGGMVQPILPAAERGLDYDVGQIRAAHEASWLRLRQSLGARDLLDGPTRAVLLWQHALQTAHALRRGWLTVAQDELARARALSPHDRLLDALQAKTEALAAAYRAGDAAQFRALWQDWQHQDFHSLVQATAPPAPPQSAQ